MTRLSHSAKEKYELCNYKYYLNYVMKYRSSLQSSALCFGNALDIALNSLLEGSGDCRLVFDHEWDKYKEINDSIQYYKSDLDLKLLTEEEMLLPIQMQNFISLKRKGHKLLEAYERDIKPRIKEVISVQGEMTIVGYDVNGEETSDSIYGKLDLIAMIEDNEGSVRHALLDNKTTSEPYAKDSVRKKDQLALYASGYPEIEYFGYLTMNKKNYKTQVIIDTIDEDKKNEVLQKFVDTLDSINKNNFEKNYKSCYAFGRQCEFYTHCHKGFFSKDIYQEKKES